MSNISKGRKTRYLSDAYLTNDEIDRLVIEMVEDTFKIKKFNSNMPRNEVITGIFKSEYFKTAIETILTRKINLYDTNMVTFQENMTTLAGSKDNNDTKYANIWLNTNDSFMENKENIHTAYYRLASYFLKINELKINEDTDIYNIDTYNITDFIKFLSIYSNGRVKKTDFKAKPVFHI